jgi:hypothetical protein
LPEYLIESYVPTADDTWCAARRVREAAEELAREGTPVRHVRTTFLPEDETCFHVVSGPALEAVAELGLRAGLGDARITVAVESAS